MDLNGLIPDYGNPILQSVEFEPGTAQMKPSHRQHVQFYEKEVFNAWRAKETNGKEAYDKKLFVKIETPGDTCPYNSFAEDYHKRTHFRQYQAFKEGKTAPQGQPITDCEFIDQGEATELIQMKIFTVEQLVDAPESALEQLARGFQLRDLARTWYKATKGAALLDTTKRIAADLSESKVTIAEQSKALEETRKELQEMRAMMRTFQEAEVENLIAAEEKPKRPPGRPRKIITDETP